MSRLRDFIDAIESKNLKVKVNLERPVFLQPEDRIKYRAHRILLILAHLNTKNGLSKEVIACMDFLLRNPGFQKSFLIHYYQDKSVIVKKLGQLSIDDQIDYDRNIVPYKSVPWDLRFNDMFLYLMIRELVEVTGSSNNLRLILSEKGKEYSKQLESIFPDECNFLEIFGKRLIEDRSINIITDIIPKTYWQQNEESFYK